MSEPRTAALRFGKVNAVVACDVSAYTANTINAAVHSERKVDKLLRVEALESETTERRDKAPTIHSEEFCDIQDFAAENVQAAMKSADILLRGVRVLNFNVRGATSMTVDDGLSAARALMGCRTTPEWLDLQSELVKLNGGRVTIRALLLSVMTIQLAEEALFPLIRRANATHGFCARALGGA